MGVVNDNNLVGMTYKIGEKFSTIISLLNTDLMISAKIKKSGHYGTLIWEGGDSQKMVLNKCQTFEDYHDIYLKSDILLLTDIFKPMQEEKDII